MIYITIGVSGCGKTTWAKQKSDALLLDSDAIRAELWGDATDQQQPAKVFEVMLARTLAAVANGQDVVYCAINLNRKKRMQTIRKIRETYPSIQIIYVLFNTAIPICIERDRERERTVGENVIWHQVKSFQYPIEGEGQTKTLRINCCENNPDEIVKETYAAMENFGLQNNPYHAETLWQHTKNVCMYAPNDLLLAATYHDCGKPYTHTTKESISHYYGHENVSAYLAMNMELPPFICAIIALHMMPFQNKVQPQWCPENVWEAVLQLHEADKKGSEKTDEGK